MKECQRPGIDVESVRVALQQARMDIPVGHVIGFVAQNRGDYVFEVFNDEYLHLAPESIVGRAKKAAQWLVDETSRATP